MAININAPATEEPALRRALIPLTQSVALSRVTALPGSPANGDTYIVPSGAGSNPDEIAVRIAGAWQYLVPAEGWVFYVADENLNYQYDGADWLPLAAGTTTIGLSFYAGGTIDASEVIFSHIAATAFTLPINLVSSYFAASAAATASTTVSISKNGSSIGSLVWAIDGTVPTVTFASAVSFVAGDLLTIRGSATPDATLAGISGSILGAL